MSAVSVSAGVPVVALVGRPNVGKSTFFNRLVGRRQAIVSPTPGVTRDRNFATVDWTGHAFIVVDTGGVVEGSAEPMDQAIRTQALAAVEEADLILFLVDGKSGVHPLDERLAELLRQSGRPVLLVVNKVDDLLGDTGYHEFWSLGLGEPHPVSAISGRGSGDLLDAVVERFPEREMPEVDENEIRIAVIGKPNVGKSSFVNRLFGEDRVLVSDIAGTTRDPVDTPMTYHGKRIVFVDTAGLRRQSRISDSLEYYSAIRTERVIHDADVCLVLVDATEPLHAQDLRVIEKAWEAGAAAVLVINKWDLVEKETGTAESFRKQAVERIPFLQWVPFLYSSAMTGQRVRKSLDLILEVNEERHRRIPTHEVNEVLERLMGRQPPPHHRGQEVKLKYATQVSTAPPTFVVFANFPKGVPEHYRRYLHNGFRAAWGFVGSPLRIRIRASSEDRYR